MIDMQNSSASSVRNIICVFKTFNKQKTFFNYCMTICDRKRCTLDWADKFKSDFVV
ncbi:hypothetical protein DPMN_031914 [Dreissena polymorpha]|uniref:Uncharacterized protein n=1 Tax=Dreissena polymorpha TaxID=45954 RepID=A0A9D4M0U0_DREPO|nr:hypothetical protein DPMN_031914 [Dreissena polymorpha]